MEADVDEEGGAMAAPETAYYHLFAARMSVHSALVPS
jgi:hypothetical protein